MDVVYIHSIVYVHWLAIHTHLEAPGASECEHVGGIARDLAVDSTTKELVDEHDNLHAQLPGGHHDHQLRPLQAGQVTQHALQAG